LNAFTHNSRLTIAYYAIGKVVFYVMSAPEKKLTNFQADALVATNPQYSSRPVLDAGLFSEQAIFSLHHRIRKPPKRSFELLSFSTKEKAQGLSQGYWMNDYLSSARIQLSRLFRLLQTEYASEALTKANLSRGNLLASEACHTKNAS
jgi:hypothetical protein